MDVLIWAAVGIGAGSLTQLLLKDNWRGGVTGNLVLGAMGAIATGWIMMRLFGPGEAPGVHVGNLIFAFLGAAALLWVGRIVAAKKVRG